MENSTKILSKLWKSPILSNTFLQGTLTILPGSNGYKNGYKNGGNFLIITCKIEQPPAKLATLTVLCCDIYFSGKVTCANRATAE